ncbi:MAG: (2Fe-2S)-binding protein [Deltaproteobacteria bacterium]|nr:(2Fe-2S)-binding protein [Deltaproteobacteria bacterium]
MTLFVDGVEVTVPAGSTILEAAAATGIRVPTLCDHPALKPRAACRLCVVECDGGHRLKAACATEVYEGARVATKSRELLNLRRTVLRLILSNHPDECPVCERNLNCELQTLAREFGIPRLPFREEFPKTPDEKDSGDILRNPDKCVKCGRCVAVCREIQGVEAAGDFGRSRDYGPGTPFGEELADGPCVACGECVLACPVGALRERDDSGAVLKALDEAGKVKVALLSPEVAPGLEDALGCPRGSVGAGGTITALKRTGFERVFGRDAFLALSALEEAGMFLSSEAPDKPFVSLCSPRAESFLIRGLPGDSVIVSKAPNPDGIFGGIFGEAIAASFLPCVARKSGKESKNPGAGAGEVRGLTFALNSRELARLAKVRGFDLAGLPPSDFDVPPEAARVPKNARGIPEGAREDFARIARAIFALDAEGERGRPFSALRARNAGRVRTLALSGGKTADFVLVFGTLEAKRVLGEKAKGVARPTRVKVMSCPRGCAGGGGQVRETVRAFPREPESGGFAAPGERGEPWNPPELPGEKELLARLFGGAEG